MLEQVLLHLNNWFLAPGEIYFGTITIETGSIVLPFLKSGQYFRIIGSVFNDGLHKYPTVELTDETFNGTIWALAIPKAVQDLADEIETWNQKNGETAMGPYQSESFGGYTYSKATDNHTGGSVTWEGAFRSRLNQWRKL